jgi:hypothetical protein
MQEPEFDYSEVYRKEEMKKLKARIKKTRNTLFISAFAIITGALLFWKLGRPAFTSKALIMYLILSIVFVCLGLLCDTRPYLALISALIICVVFWAVEIFLTQSDNPFNEGLIQKIFIIALLLSAFNNSREAELLRKELLFS